MKLNYIAMLSVISILNMSSVTLINQHPVRAESASSVTSAKPRSGKFITDQSQTKGTARFVTINGIQYLELKDFKTDDGPDLFVILHRSDKPESYEQKDYINLGRLKKLDGDQLYRLPNNIDLSKYSSAVIWCKQFNVTMGYASFNGETAAKPNPCAAKPNPCAAKPNPCAGR